MRLLTELEENFLMIVFAVHNMVKKNVINTKRKITITVRVVGWEHVLL